MKRFLSIMLTVMLVLSSFVMVSADSEFTLTAVTEEETFSFGDLYQGSIKVSADVFVVSAGTNATLWAMNDGLEVGSTAVDGTKVAQWQNVEFFSLDEAITEIKIVTDNKVYVNNIKAEKIYKSTTVYEEDFEAEVIYSEDFESLTAGETVTGYQRHDYTVFEPGAANEPAITYTVAENKAQRTGKMGTLYKAAHTESWTSWNDDDSVDTNAISTGSSAAIQYMDMDNYYIDVDSNGADHIMVQFEVYNPLNRPYGSDPATRKAFDELIFAVGDKSKTGTSIFNETNADAAAGLASAFIGHNKVSNSSKATYTDVDAPYKTWQSVVFEAERYLEDGIWNIDYSVTYGGQTVEYTVANTTIENFDRFYFSLNPRFGGRYYIDNFIVYDITGSAGEDSEDGGIYSENFESLTTGETVTGYETHDFTVFEPGAANEPVITYTVAENKAGRTGKMGTLYKAAHTESWTCHNDDDSVDNNHISTGSSGAVQYFDMDNVYIDIDSNGSNHILVEFEVYNPINRPYGSGESRRAFDELMFAVGDKSKTSMFNESNGDTAAGLASAFIGHNKVSNSSKATYTDVVAPYRTWQNVVFEAERYEIEDGVWNIDYSIGYGGSRVEYTVENTDVESFERLYFSLHPRFGGRYYIDNLVVHDLEAGFVEGDGAVAADTVSGYKFYDYYQNNDADDTIYTSFTASAGVGDNSSMVGNLYNRAYKDGERITDLGGTDFNVTYNPNDSSKEYFYVDAGIENAAKVNASFKVYLAGNAEKDDAYQDKFCFGLSDSGHCSSAQTPNVMIDPEYISYQTNIYNAGLFEGEIAELSHQIGAKKWIDVTYVAERYQEEHEETGVLTNFIKYTVYLDGIEQFTEILEDASDSWKYLVFGIDDTFGGRAYIDDIKVEALEDITSEEDLSGADTVGLLLYSLSAELPASSGQIYDITGYEVENDEIAYVTVRKNAETEGPDFMLTSVFNGGLLMSATTNEFNVEYGDIYADVSVELENKVEALSGYTLKVYIFDSSASLKPLAKVYKPTIQ